MPEERSNRWVGIVFPKGLGMTPHRFAELCEWKLRKDGDRYLVCLKERYSKTAPKLLVLDQIAKGEAVDRGRYDLVTKWQEHDRYMGPHAQSVAAEVWRLLETKGREEMWEAFRLAVKSVPDAELPEFLKVLMQQIVSQMPKASMWGIHTAPALSWRLGAARAMFAAQETPEALEVTEEGFRGFEAMRNLQSPTMFGYMHYIDFGLLPCTPWVIGIHSARVGGAVVVLFGQMEAGKTRRPATEMLQLFAAQSLFSAADMRVLSQPTHSAETIRRHYAWWISTLNRFFGALLDPCNHVQDDLYDVARQQAFLLSVERLFEAMQSLLIYYRRDPALRPLLFFTCMDLLEGMGQGPRTKLFSARHSRKILERLEQHLSAAAKEVLLPRCRQGIDALEAVQDGFHVQARRQGEEIQLRRKDGRWETKSLDSAAADYLVLLRNSIHSFRDMALDSREISLLASHTGELAPELADLAFLHVLDFVTDPRGLIRARANVYGNSASPRTSRGLGRIRNERQSMTRRTQPERRKGELA